MKKRIGILGANGQLGSEVCLLLSQMKGIEPVPICRNAVGASFLKRCGLEVRIGKTDSEKNSREVLAGLDLIADFSLPAGSSSYVRAQMDQIIGNTVRYAPKGIPFVYLSSILAFGNPDFHAPLKSYRVSENAYGSTKRYAEALTQKLAAQYKRPAYLYRVGVVYGELQAATRQSIKDVKASANLTAYIPDCDSYTVFAFSIAEALISALEKKDNPGLYTVVSSPAWSWQDLHQYLMKKAGVEQKVVLLKPENLPQAGWTKGLQQSVFKLLRKRKEFLNGYIGAVSPKFEQKMRATYHMRNAAAEIRHGLAVGRYTPYFENFTVYPGGRLHGISDSRMTMGESAAKLKKTMDELAETGQVQAKTMETLQP